MRLDKFFDFVSIDIENKFDILTYDNAKEERFPKAENINDKFKRNEYGFYTEETIEKLVCYRVTGAQYDTDGFKVYVTKVC